MQFMLLIQEPRGQRATRSAAEGREAYAVMQRFAETLQGRGVLRGVESLQSDDSGTRVEVRGGRPRLTDGPFIEAKEMVGGFFLVECASREEALEIAAACPAAAWATVEVRPVGPCYT